MKYAHSLTEVIEKAVKATLPNMETTVHIEPIEEPASYLDSALLSVEEAAKREQNQ